MRNVFDQKILVRVCCCLTLTVVCVCVNVCRRITDCCTIYSENFTSRWITAAELFRLSLDLLVSFCVINVVIVFCVPDTQYCSLLHCALILPAKWQGKKAFQYRRARALHQVQVHRHPIWLASQEHFTLTMI